MTNLLKILKYTFYDGLRSKWTFSYFFFFLFTTFALLYFSENLSKAIASMMNITIIITPLISTIFSVMHFYNSKDFIEMLMAQPIKRSSIFLGQYFGLVFSLCLSFTGGTVIPFLSYGIIVSSEVWDYFFLIISGTYLTFIFAAISFTISVLNENRIKGFGFAILIWLYMAVIYDGLILLFFVSFSDYPLDNASIILTMLNPIDLSRILVLLNLDVSALMGYTGAVFNNFFGTTSGILLSILVLNLWVIFPLAVFTRIINTKDF